MDEKERADGCGGEGEGEEGVGGGGSMKPWNPDPNPDVCCARSDVDELSIGMTEQKDYHSLALVRKARASQSAENLVELTRV